MGAGTGCIVLGTGWVRVRYVGAMSGYGLGTGTLCGGDVWVRVGYGYAMWGRCLGTLGTLVRCKGTTEVHTGCTVWEQCVCFCLFIVVPVIYSYVIEIVCLNLTTYYIDYIILPISFCMFLLNWTTLHHFFCAYFLCNGQVL